MKQFHLGFLKWPIDPRCTLVFLLIIKFHFNSFCHASYIAVQTTEEEVSTPSTVDGDANNNNGDGSLLQSNDPHKVGFYLYPDPKDMTYAEQIYLGDSGSLKNSSYNSRNPPIFLVHGFLNNYTTKYSQKVKNAFLQTGYGSRNNIIVVDWGMLSTPANQTAGALSPVNDWSHNLFYREAVSNVPKVGRRIAEFIYFLMDQQTLSSPSDVHVIGFSLGGQIAGFAGLFTKQNTSTLIGRITGLDPAGPLYQNEINSDKKLDKSDGAFVDVIHSNQGQDGMSGSVGTADFYPNGGGPNQPDCLEIGVGVVGDTVTGSCAHNRAWIYYIKSFSEQITACGCLSYADLLCRTLCTNKVAFGINCPFTARGSYYLDIIGKEP